MEKAHDISLDEPCVAHQAILFMLDVLMRNTKSILTLAELYDSFGDKSFTPQMLRAVGGNEQGLKQFLQRYPSLFTVNGDNISANSGGSQLPRNSTTPERYLRKTKAKQDVTDGSILPSSTSPNSSGDLINSSSSSSSSSENPQKIENPSLLSAETPQFSSKSMKEIEQEAIAFFRKQMSKREEDWLPIVSVAGHASQSSSDVRKYVGPQNEFKNFLVRYPNVFSVRDEYCGLKGKADTSTQPFPPPSPPPKRRTTNVTLIGTNGLPAGVATIGSNSLLTRGQSFKSNSNRYSACGNMMPNSTLNLVNANSLMQSQGLVAQVQAMSIQNNMNPNNNQGIQGLNGASIISQPSSQGMSKPRLTPVEVKAVHYVMRILHKNGRMLLQTIPGLISRAPDQVSNIVGFTREDLIQFFKRHSAIFQLHPDGCVSVKQDAVKALILKDNLNANGNPGLNSNSGNSNEFNAGAIITSNGVILRIFPKYGILNMENNEQVFFDIQSCQFETFSDLTTILHTGDRLYFNAIIGPRDGSTKWRSLKTWIKMRNQNQVTTSSNNNNNIMSLDNMSTHSDTDIKSDDSSTSSQGGGYINGNTSSSRRLNRNLNVNQQNPTVFNQNNEMLYQNSRSYGSNVSDGHNTPTQSTNFSSSSPIRGSQNQLVNGQHTGINGSPSNLSLDNESNNESNNTNNTNLGNSNSSNMISSLSGDFNLYQLDSGDYNPTTNSSGANSATGGTIDENSELLISSTHSNSNQLIHSNSANNLQSIILQNNPHLAENQNKLPTPKSAHSFNSLTPPNEQETKDNQKPNNYTGTTNTSQNLPQISTKFIRQAADNISEKSVCENNPKLVSMGCQTFSTGDITVSNVYIE